MHRYCAGMDSKTPPAAGPAPSGSRPPPGAGAGASAADCGCSGALRVSGAGHRHRPRRDARHQHRRDQLPPAPARRGGAGRGGPGPGHRPAALVAGRARRHQLGVDATSTTTRTRGRPSSGSQGDQVRLLRRAGRARGSRHRHEWSPAWRDAVRHERHLAWSPRSGPARRRCEAEVWEVLDALPRTSRPRRAADARARCTLYLAALPD